ncbi:hypothetical protein [Aliivibrio fischeri]|uniref:hypothetical protein n=1 Tax=Aliivibrio fischeri TaxID=668 RepID=UPI001F246ECB|nr:hypothetical protein [Aliivibrio fischeri]MCE7553921.1 hypothetical protein [Aliivibrio fischeri]MCE7561227.1 hypothetical protein [Aliivibrio fischeri]MCE7568635.1 hypothetical protein [Aliivibrio fischeri]
MNNIDNTTTNLVKAIFINGKLSSLQYLGKMRGQFTVPLEDNLIWKDMLEFCPEWFDYTKEECDASSPFFVAHHLEPMCSPYRAARIENPYQDSTVMVYGIMN